MKHHPMAHRSEKLPPPLPRGPRKGEAAFDLWLQRGLHQLFDEVAKEPIPEGLLRLIEDDRGDGEARDR
jgi:hypothetical protein